LEGLSFGEGPRWYRGALWFSDIHGGAVHRVDDSGDTIIVEIDEQPSGLGWLPDGTLLVSAMRSGRVLRYDPLRGLECHVDLSGPLRGVLNDMIVRSDGTAYVGDMGARIFDEKPDFSVPGQIFVVSPAGRIVMAWDELRAPNGMVLSGDERRMIVAESGGSRLTAFDVAADGTLHRMTTFAELHPSDPLVPVAAPDGICLDAEGAVWVADPIGRRVVRVQEGGQVTDEHGIDGLNPVACVLAGRDRRTLFICAAEGWAYHDVAHTRTGRIIAMDVAVPGAGAP
jgi:sugar lactone lactonase YvrE